MNSKQRKRQRKVEENRVQKRVLTKTGELLLGLANGLGNAMESGWSVYRVSPIASARRDGYDGDPFWDEYRRLKALEKKRVVKLKRSGRKIEYRITNDGWHETLKLRILTSEALLPEGEVCMVAFDIPEDIANVRRTFRYLLRRAKFRQVQRSVWVSNRDITRELAELVKVLRVEKYVRVYLSRRVTI